MTITESVKTCLQKFIDFSGRASRSEYWWFFLFTFIVRIVTFWIPFVGTIIALALLLPNLSVTARRLHDTNRTGWWMLMPLGLGLAGIIVGAIFGVAIAGDDEWGFLLVISLGTAGGLVGFAVGYLVLLYFLIQPSDPAPNRYGPSPLQQQGVGGYGYYQEPGELYPPTPSAGSYTESPYDSGIPDSLSEPDRAGGQFCTQCGMRLQPEARFCTVCGTAV